MKTVALRSLAAACGLLFFAAAAVALPFTPGNLVVYRVGNGSTSLTAAAAPVFIDEYTVAGILVQSIAMPTVTSGAQRALTASGNITSEGYLSRSADNHY